MERFNVVVMNPLGAQLYVKEDPLNLECQVDCPKPFVKWAGGKSQLLPVILARLPAELRRGEIDTYIEPFVGGGAVFFAITSRHRFKRVVLIDKNANLIAAYRTIQKAPEALISNLEKLESEFLPLPAAARLKFYLKKRFEFNQLQKASGASQGVKSDAQRAVLFIFLNKTCFNGLYRVNSSGEFNVPMGKYANPKLFDAVNIWGIAARLRNVELLEGDYTAAAHFASKGTFVYFDPPYRPLTKSSSFSSYDPSGFDDQSQIALAKFFGELDAKGSKLMLSNSDPQQIDPDDDFFTTLYSKFCIEKVPVRRNINSVGSQRGEISEILVTNYKQK